MSMRFSISLACGLCLWGCDPGTVHVVRYPDGKIREMWTEKGPAGKPTRREGKFASFYADGRRESALEYHDGKKAGGARYWSPTGDLLFEGKYHGDFLMHEKRYAADGKVIFDQGYVVKSAPLQTLGPDGDSLSALESCAYVDGPAGIRQGLCAVAYADGHPLSTRYYQAGKLHGPVKAWFPDGKPWMEGEYAQGLPSGAWRTWMRGGVTSWTAAYAHGEKNGLAREWFPDGKPKSKAQFRTGKQEGEYREWYPNGRVRLLANYTEGRREGNENAWYPDGGRLYAAHYAQGRLDGDFWQWYPADRLRLHCQFRAGRKDGPSKVWYRKGRLLELANYKQGRLHGAYRTFAPEGGIMAAKEFKEGNPASDSKAKEILELLGAAQARVPVGLAGFYWGMGPEECRANLSLLEAGDIRVGTGEIQARAMVFSGRRPAESQLRLQFNAQNELWAISLNILQKSPEDYFPLCENLESEMGGELGTATLRKGDAQSPYYLLRKRDWGSFSITPAGDKPVREEMPVVSAEAFSPGRRGWFRFTLANHLYREYVDPANASITPPRWPETAVFAGR